MGYRPLQVQAAVDTLGHMVNARVVVGLVTDVDWAKFTAAFEMRSERPVLSKLRPVTPARGAVELCTEAAV